jgi:hypothetical protein
VKVYRQLPDGRMTFDEVVPVKDNDPRDPFGWLALLVLVVCLGLCIWGLG